MFSVFSSLQSAKSLAIFGAGPQELLIVGVIVVLLFGNRLPGAAKSLGQSFSAFKKGISEGADDDDTKSQAKIESKV